MDTGSGGSFGSLSDPESREFKAIFKAPPMKLVETYIPNLEHYLRESLEHYRKRQPK